MSNPISADESEARSLAAPAALRRMKRPAAQEKTLVRIAKWRALCPGLTIRSTFIVGFPGETEEEFSELLAFLEEARLDRVGCFRYEAVQGAAANKIAPHVPEETKVERYARCMEAQQKISAKRMKRAVGTRQAVIIDQAEIGTAVGRSRGDAPAIDGVVHVRASRPLKVGEIATIKIERADECDLYGTAVGF